MNHIDFADGTSAWLTDEQLKQQYPDLHANLMQPQPHKEYGQKLKTMRQKRDYCISELAKMLNMKISKISDIEQGKVMPSQEVVDFYGTLKQRVV